MAVRITIRVKPGASRPRVGGEHAGALVVSVTKRAVDGAATHAALEALAAALRVRPREVTLITGATHRTKVVEINVPGEDASVSARIADLLAGGDGDLHEARGVVG